MTIPVAADLKEIGKTILENVDDLNEDTQGQVAMEENASTRERKVRSK